jgi:hypothetical protein
MSRPKAAFVEGPSATAASCAIPVVGLEKVRCLFAPTRVSRLTRRDWGRSTTSLKHLPKQSHANQAHDQKRVKHKECMEAVRAHRLTVRQCATTPSRTSMASITFAWVTQSSCGLSGAHLKKTPLPKFRVF